MKKIQAADFSVQKLHENILNMTKAVNLSIRIFIMRMSSDDSAKHFRGSWRQKTVTIWTTLISKTLVVGLKKTQKAKYNQASVCCYVRDLWKATGAPHWSHAPKDLRTDHTAVFPVWEKKHNVTSGSATSRSMFSFTLWQKHWNKPAQVRRVGAKITVPVCDKKAMAAAGWLVALLCAGWSWKLEAWGLDSLLRGSYTTLAEPSWPDSGWQAVWLSRTGVGREAGKKMSLCSLVYLGVVGASPADCWRQKKSSGREEVWLTLGIHLQS